MSEKSNPIIKSSLGERLPDLAVLLLVVLALLAGWFLKTSVENRSTRFEVDGLTAYPPSGWLTINTQGNELLHVTDPLGSGYGTTYVIEEFPVDPQAPIGQTASFLTLQRSQALTAYRVLDQKQVTAFGDPAYEISYVFVESNPNLTHDVYPNVVKGLDYIFLDGDKAVVVSYLADKQVFSADLGRFQKFLETLAY